jgi:hypothetical protein
MINSAIGEENAVETILNSVTTLEQQNRVSVS